MANGTPERESEGPAPIPAEKAEGPSAGPVERRGEKVLVTGATGFIGRHMVSALRRKGFAVRALVHRTEAADAGLPGDVEVVRGDITARSSLSGLAQGVSHAVHLAGARPDAPLDPTQLAALIEQGTRNVLLEAESVPVRRFVYLACVGADEKSKSAFYRLQANAENLVRGSRCEGHFLFRASAVFGPGDSFTRSLLAKVRSRSPVVCMAGYGDTLYQPIHVEDLCDCLLAPLIENEMAPTARPLELGGEEIVSLLQALDAGLRYARRFKVKLHCPLFLMQLGAPIIERISRDPVVSRDRVIELLADHTCQTANDARRLVGGRLRRFSEFLKARVEGGAA